MTTSKRKPVEETITDEPEAEVSTFGDMSREFASVGIELADLVSADGKAFVKMSMGSDTAAEAILSMHARYGIPVSVDTACLVAQATDTASMFLLHVPVRGAMGSTDVRSFLVIDRAYWNEVKASPLGGNGTDQETVGVFVTLAHEADRAAKQRGRPLTEVRGVLSE